MILAPPRHGKALALDTPIATPSGWSGLGDLLVGDFVFDEKGQPCRVTAKSEVWTDRPCYEVITDDGDAIVADAAHEWRANLDRRSSFRRHTTQVIARQRSKRALVEMPRPIACTQALLPIDPYVLGVWLGDGCSYHATITASTLHGPDSDSAFIRREIQAAGYETSDRATRKTFGVLGLQAQLRALGLLEDKHVPAQYLRASVRQRRALLQGLVDTDGYVAPDGQVEFCTTSPMLADAAREIVWSLGVKAFLVVGRAILNGRDIGPKYRVMFYMTDAARLPRKAARCRDATRTPSRYIEARAVDPVPTQCIQVDSPSRLFLAGRSMTPTHNSELATVRFPAYALGKNPALQVVSASYNADLAVDFGKKVRNLIRSPRYANIFPATKLKADSTASDLWHTSGGGVYRTVGIKGGATGFGSDLLSIDDPIKDRKEADSQTFRDECWQWYTSAAYTRLMSGIAPGGVIVFTYTPWHEDDLGHRILKQAERSGERWTVLRLPATAEVGDPLHREAHAPLWPDRYSSETLQVIRRTIGEREWSALYQCRPQPEGGRYIERNWLRFYDPDQLPRGVRTYLSTDWAVSEEESADWTVHQVWAYLDPNLYLLDMYRDKREPDITIEAGLDLCEQYRPMAWINEKGQLNKAIRPFLAKRARERHITTRLVDIARTHDKEIMGRPLQAMASSGRVYLPAEAAYLDDLLGEWLRFPAGNHDDTFDPAALLAQHLEQLRSTRKEQTSYVGRTPFAERGGSGTFSPFGR